MRWGCARVYAQNVTDEQPVEDADVIPLRNPDGTLTAQGSKELGAEGRQRARFEAARRKTIFKHRAKGAKLRADMLPRALTKPLAEGGVNLMLAMILQQEYEPKTAKEAADVAKILSDIARHEEGPADGKARIRERGELEQSAQLLRDKALERARAAQGAAAEALGGAVPDGEPVEDVDLSEWDFGTDDVPDDGVPDGYAPDVATPQEG